MSNAALPRLEPDAFENAHLGEGCIVEPNVHLGFRYHKDCGPARIGDHSMLRLGTILYGDVTVGRYFQTGHYTVIRAKVTAGDYCTISNQSTLEGLTELGEGVRIMSHVYIPTRTRIGDNVFIGPRTVFLNDRKPGRWQGDPPMPIGPTIEDHVVIGGGCTILPGVRIGRQSFIAAGATVIGNVPPHSLVVGTPGRIKPLSADLDQPNLEKLTHQPVDLWHPDTPDLDAVTWPDPDQPNPNRPDQPPLA